MDKIISDINKILNKNYPLNISFNKIDTLSHFWIQSNDTRKFLLININIDGLILNVQYKNYQIIKGPVLKQKILVTIIKSREITDQNNDCQLTQEERDAIAFRKYQQLNQLILNNLQDEIEEKYNKKEEILSLNMVQITMDFNELSKRISDMNNPEFWL